MTRNSVTTDSADGAHVAGHRHLRRRSRARRRCDCAQPDSAALSATWVALSRNIWPSAETRMPSNLVDQPDDVVVPVRDHNRRVLEQDLLDRLAGHLLCVDPDRRLVGGEGGVELGRRVLRRVPDAAGRERGVEVHVGRGTVAVVDDAELGRSRARRVGGLGRAPLGAVERVEALAGEVEREPCLGRLGLDQLRQLGDLLQLAEVQVGGQAVGEPGVGEQLPWRRRCRASRCGTEASKNG